MCGVCCQTIIKKKLSDGGIIRGELRTSRTQHQVHHITYTASRTDTFLFILIEPGMMPGYVIYVTREIMLIWITKYSMDN